MDSINIHKPFAMMALCEIEYDGRARSTVGKGRRLIIHKIDGTLLIHRSLKITPLNYNGPKSTLYKYDNKLISISPKSEKIIVTIYDIFMYEELDDWSSDSINLTGSEAQLCDKLITHCKHYLNIDHKEVYKEYPTRLGNIDIVFIDKTNIRHCIEVKRKKANMSAVYQLHRYMKEIHGIGYLAAPDISDNAMAELVRLNYKFIKIFNI